MDGYRIISYSNRQFLSAILPLTHRLLHRKKSYVTRYNNVLNMEIFEYATQIDVSFRSTLFPAEL